MDMALAPLERAKRAARARKPKTFRPLRKARSFSRSVARNRKVPKPQVCKETAPAFRDAMSGWFGYNCGDGVLLVPSPRCVGPECRGGGRQGTPVLGFAGDLDAGSRGSFIGQRNMQGLTAYDGVSIGKGLAAIDDLANRNEIDRFYAGAAKRAYLEQLSEEPGPDRLFEEPSPFGRVLAPGALRRRFAGATGEDVGPSVREACGCKPRPFDARDPVSGWGIYYVKGGIFLTPSEKCIGGGGPPNWWEQAWRNTVNLFRAAPEEPSPPRPTVVPGEPLPPRPTAPPGSPPPPPTPGYLCLDPRIWPLAWRPSSTPCVPPQVPYPM